MYNGSTWPLGRERGNLRLRQNVGRASTNPRHYVRYAMATARQKNKVEKVMHEHKEGTLKSGSGKKVRSRKQAIAIAMSESGQSKRKKPAERSEPDVATGIGATFGPADRTLDPSRIDMQGLFAEPTPWHTPWAGSGVAAHRGDRVHSRPANRVHPVPPAVAPGGNARHLAALLPPLARDDPRTHRPGIAGVGPSAGAVGAASQNCRQAGLFALCRADAAKPSTRVPRRRSNISRSNSAATMRASSYRMRTSTR
jgi:hypothetical protein